MRLCPQEKQLLFVCVPVCVCGGGEDSVCGCVLLWGGMYLCGWVCRHNLAIIITSYQLPVDLGQNFLEGQVRERQGSEEGRWWRELPHS